MFLLCDVDVLISINANSPSLQELLLMSSPLGCGSTQGRQMEWSKRQPPTGGSLAPAPLPNGQFKSGF